ncbi:hypothetical protein ACFLYO_07750, partial [Chloroflexota bacterium]
TEQWEGYGFGMRNSAHQDVCAGDLAFEIALNHVENVAQVFAETGTFWENYAPESTAPGVRAKPDFVGWTGISAISIPLEYLIGIKQDAAAHTINWAVRLTERHGVCRYALGRGGTADLICEARPNNETPPLVTVETDAEFNLVIVWDYATYEYPIEPGSTRLDLSKKEWTYG